jgi:hypothetical protein
MADSKSSKRGLEFYFLGLMCLAFWTVSLLFAFVPNVVLADVEMELTTPSAFAEVRAAYGGGFLGYGFLCFSALRRPELRVFCLGICTLALGGFAGLRLASFFIDGPPNPHSMMMQGLETLGFLVSAAIWQRSRKG